MRRLIGRLRPYAWGSRTEIARLQGRPPSAQPEAELWWGAHPDDPSLVAPRRHQGGAPAGLDPEAANPGAASLALEGAAAGGDQHQPQRSLLDEIAADPVGMLGAGVSQRYGPRLPFLLKLLAAESNLSLQTHPGAAQARAGFDAEEAAGVPRDAPWRNYVDRCHKPELLVAVTEFRGLCGFREVAASLQATQRLQAPALSQVVACLRQPDPGRALRDAFTSLLTMSDRRSKELLGQVAPECRRLADADGGADYALVAELAERYPDDVGVVCALLLNQVWLRPGEAIFMPPGNVHAYLRGVGVEVMAASDNVLRAGLTPKHVDVPELLRVVRFEEAEPRITAKPAAPGVCWWPAPTEDFRLTRADVDGVTQLPGQGPRIVLCLTGRVRADDGHGVVDLGPGEAGFAAAAAAPVALEGVGQVFQVSVGG